MCFVLIENYESLVVSVLMICLRWEIKCVFFFLIIIYIGYRGKGEFDKLS